jgi:hypothetical protein
MHRFLAVYCFILPLLHVSTRACHHQGALPCLLSYMPIECNGGMVIIRENVIMCCLVWDIVGHKAMVEW